MSFDYPALSWRLHQPDWCCLYRRGRTMIHVYLGSFCLIVNIYVVWFFFFLFLEIILIFLSFFKEIIKRSHIKYYYLCKKKPKKKNQAHQKLVEQKSLKGNKEKEKHHMLNKTLMVCVCVCVC